jgi:hypothetical protein
MVKNWEEKGGWREKNDDKEVGGSFADYPLTLHSPEPSLNNCASRSTVKAHIHVFLM